MDETLHDRIKSMIDSDRVVLFMKGSKLFPQCGFSAQVVNILKQSQVSFTEYNVLTDPDVRAGIKEYANWPTIPQLYVDGKFVGGCDIVTQLYQNGELSEVLEASD